MPKTHLWSASVVTTASAGRPGSASWVTKKKLGASELAGATLETLDGDGVRFRVAVGSTEGFLSSDEVGYVVPGSEGAPLALTLEDARRFETRLPVEGIPARGPSMIPFDMPWVVAIGDPLGIDQIGASDLLERESRIAVTRIEDSRSLPSRAWGYDGVDIVLINGAGVDVLESMSPLQRDALIQWNRQGGRSLWCLGESADRIAEVAPWVTELLPIETIETVRMDPAALETFTTSQTPLDVFTGIKLPRQVGKIMISGRTKTRRLTAVLAAQYPLGFGKVTVMAADLDSENFADWPERLDLVLRLTDDVLSEVDPDQLSTDRATSFDDLAGQMRGTLDQFSIKPRFSFSFVSLIVMLLVAAVGPLDYLLVNRLLGRPLLGWLSFPLMAIGLSVVLASQAKPSLESADRSSSSDLLRANQIQVVDIDRIDGVGRGFAWSYTYSHDPADVDLAMPPSSDLSSLGTDIGAMLYPMGYPGRTFGGIQLAGENTLLPTYDVREDEIGQRLESLAIASRSSKSIATQLQFVPREDELIEMTRRPGSELLRGELINPLSIDLLDGMLVYRNWVYLLPTRFRGASRIAAVQDLRQKNFRWLLTKQQALEKSGTETTPWVVGDFSNSRRVAEMLLFHKAAGGTLYTGLKDGPLSHLDLSHLLVDDRCILVGRTEQPLIDFGVKNDSADEDSFTAPNGSSLCMVRIVLPVRSTRLD